jgi:hypothetical protein
VPIRPAYSADFPTLNAEFATFLDATFCADNAQDDESSGTSARHDWAEQCDCPEPDLVRWRRAMLRKIQNPDASVVAYRFSARQERCQTKRVG